MTAALLSCAAGVIVGMPIVLYGILRLDERPGRSGWALVLLGLLLVAVPVTAALLLQQEEAGTGRYVGR